MSTATNDRSLRAWYQRLFSVTAQWYFLMLGAFAITVQCVYLIMIPPASGFETSVVTAYPLPYWIAFGACLAAIVAVFLGSAITVTGYWRHAFVLLVCNYGLFFSLPVVRGYELYGRGNSDTLVHVAVAKSIATYGDLSGDLFYPYIRILLAELSLVGLPIEGGRYVVPFVFTLLFIASSGLVVRELTGDHRALALGLCAATPLLFVEYHTEIHPAVLSSMLLPFVLTMLERIRRTNSRRHVVLVSTISFGIIFLHPVTTALLLVLILSTVSFGPVYEWIERNAVSRLRPVLAFAIFVVGFEWYISLDRTRRIIEDIVGGEGTAPAVRGASKASDAVLSIGEILIRFVQLYGSVVVYFLIAGSFSLLVFAHVVRHGRGSADEYEYSEVYGSYQFAVGSLLVIVLLGGYVLSSNPVRVSRYTIAMAVIAVALLLRRASSATRPHRPVLVVLVGGAVVTAGMLGAFATYQPNQHMTDMEYEGTEFMAEYHNPFVPVRSLDLTQKMDRYVSSGSVNSRGPSPFQNEPENALALHLGYDENDTAVRTFDTSGSFYIATQQYDLEYYTAAYYTPAQQRERFVYDTADIERMRHDPTVDKIYANGGFEGWYVSNDESTGQQDGRRTDAGR